MNTSKMTGEIITAAAAETEACGRRYAATLAPGDNIILQGELGSGKTTFMRGVAAGLGLNAAVASPTFTLVNLYKNDQVVVAHIDLYRLESGHTAELGLEEFFGPDYISFIEWGDKLSDELKKRYTFRRIDFTHAGGDKRRICCLT